VDQASLSSATDLLTLEGEWRFPAQLLQHQHLNSGPTVHDAAIAASLNLTGAPIEGPTHFTQFVPLALQAWGNDWLARGRISAHYKSPVSEGQSTQAQLNAVRGANTGDIRLHAEHDRTVLEGSVSFGSDPVETTCSRRLAAARAPEERQILDQVRVGMRSEPTSARLTFDEPIGTLYPFTLNTKLDVITEPHEWYRSSDNPWGAPLIPIEMISPLLHQHNDLASIPISRPSVGLFLDQEIAVHNGPLLVGENYVIAREVAAVGGSRSTESYWLRTTATDGSGLLRATMLLHIGFLRRTVTD
jgi:hypothetical protein